MCFFFLAMQHIKMQRIIIKTKLFFLFVQQPLSTNFYTCVNVCQFTRIEAGVIGTLDTPIASNSKLLCHHYCTNLTARKQFSTLKCRWNVIFKTHIFAYIKREFLWLIQQYILHMINEIYTAK